MTCTHSPLQDLYPFAWHPFRCEQCRYHRRPANQAVEIAVFGVILVSVFEPPEHELSDDPMKSYKFNTTSFGRFRTLLPILCVPLVSQAQTPVIQHATVNLAKGAISLAGANFSPSGAAPTVAVGGTSRTVYSFTNTALVVEVPSNLSAATYLVSVTNSVPHSGSAYVTVGAVGPEGPAGPAGPTRSSRRDRSSRPTGTRGSNWLDRTRRAARTGEHLLHDRQLGRSHHHHGKYRNSVAGGRLVLDLRQSVVRNRWRRNGYH